MAKKPNDGQLREELKKKTTPDTQKLVEVVVNAPPEDSAYKTLETAADYGVSVVSRSGVEITPANISKTEAELLVKRFKDKKKEDMLPLAETVSEVKKHNQELQKLKKSKKQQPMQLIRQLRVLDPKGKRTCGFCGVRVGIDKMDSKQELCEICAA